MRINMIFAVLFLFLTGCSDEEPSPSFVLGKNLFTMEVDGDTRSYYVHVPSGYDENTSAPVVFMLHGTSGDGERFYNISGWKEVGETENILTVYPSSWRYCIIDDGQVKNTTKWNIYPGTFEYCAGETPRDDIQFLRAIIEELNQLFNVNNKKIYLAGFSNGGAMAFRCGVEMSDVLAAVVESAGSYFRDTTFVSQRNLPVTFQFGNLDYGIPMDSFEFVLNHSNAFQSLVQTHTSTFGFEADYELSGTEETVLVARYEGVPASENRHFNIVIINGLGHNYPNGSNHSFMGAEVNWEWFDQFSLP